MGYVLLWNANIREKREKGKKRERERENNHELVNSDHMETVQAIGNSIMFLTITAIFLFKFNKCHFLFPKFIFPSLLFSFWVSYILPRHDKLDILVFILMYNIIDFAL